MPQIIIGTNSYTPQQLANKITERLRKQKRVDLELSQEQQKKLDIIRNSQKQQHDLSYKIGGTVNQF